MQELILTVRARRLMKEMRQLRTDRKMTVARAASQLGISEPTLWRMENGKTKINPEVLIAALDLYDVRSPRREALEQLALDTLRRGWWAPFRDAFSGSYVALESDASELRVNAFVVPGFFQTDDYARATIVGTRSQLPLAEAERRVEARMARQRALLEDRVQPPLIHVLLDESVLRRQVAGVAALRRQLARLAEEASKPHVTIQVVPFASGSHPGMEGEFVIVDFTDPEDDPFVYEEGLFGDIYIETPDDISRYRQAFDHAAADLALPTAASIEMITALSKENS